MKPNFIVTKASGVTEPFSIEKLKLSLERSRATPAEIEIICNQLQSQLYQGISTKKIYSEAFKLLKHHSKHHAARYQLKKGLLDLGPSGYPFEKFIAKLFEMQDYETITGQIVKGKCVSHEIDVIANKNNEIIVIECKYRNAAGITVDIKTPLYIHSRFNDVVAGGYFKNEQESINGWLITNAKFTTDAITYGKCSNLNLLSWDYPAKNSLRELIDNYNLYPLTCLTTLSKQEKQWLLSHDMVLAKDIYNNETILLKAGVSSKRIQIVKEEGLKLFKEGNSNNK